MNLLFVRHLTVIDFSFLDARRGLVGESWIVDVTLEGELDEQGMVFDFSHVKKTIKRGIDDWIDHKLAVPLLEPGLQWEQNAGDIVLQLPLQTGGTIAHRSPECAVALLDCDAVTPEQIEPLLAQMLRSLLPDNVKHIGIRLREEPIEGAYYHYSHGLKKHEGNCQRIAHGHRSRLEIFLDGMRSFQDETRWAKQWNDIYIATREDLTEVRSIQGVDHAKFRYQANQGAFELCLPASQVYYIDTDSTVEWIAQHIAECLKVRHPDQRIEVHAYEGVDKGSIAIR